MNEMHQREAAIFDAALELPAGERAAHLDYACAGDAALRARVEALLRECESGEGVLDSPADPEAAEAAIGPSLSSEKPGDTIGRYKLLEQIGAGGCGLVYVAEQTEPVRRRVALKIIKLGMDTRSVIARFEAERQALAMMDHPSIAKVFDAGATETGRPYFVMELVRGLKITDYCDQAKLSTRARLDLFIQVCQAIQHAHQKGIIHRDIKPSNILVTVNDGAPVPKVIDFGIAKATAGQQLTDKTIYTAFEQFIGTPAYMSPEQAVLTSLDIDTRSDIYALGVLLYELLTGKTPFDAKELLAIGLDEMRRAIREQDPQRPSTRLSTLPGQELSTMAQRRGLDAPKLVSELHGDLDWIVMKALEKDRSRRYETANGLAADVQRHLNNEPVVAYPPSRLYRLQKTVRRNKLAFSAAAAVVAALTIGLSISTWRFVNEREALKRAVAAEQAAKVEKDSADAVLNFFLEKVLAAGRPEGVEGGLGKDTTLRQAIDAAETNVAQAFQDRPLVEAEIRGTLGESYRYLGEPDLAIPQVQRALALRRERLGFEHPLTVDALGHLAAVYFEAGKIDKALPLLEETLTRQKEILGPEHSDTLKSANNLAQAYWKAGNRDQAFALMEETLKLRKAKSGPEHRETLTCIHNLGVAYLDSGKLDKGIPLLEEAVRLREARFGPGHLQTLSSMNTLGEAYRVAGKLDKAIPLLEKAFSLCKANLGPKHPRTLRVMHTLGLALRDARHLDQLETMYRHQLAQESDRVFTAAVLRARADLRVSRGQFAEAAVDLSRVIEIDADQHEVWHALAALLVQQGEFNAYREHCRKSLERFSNTTAPITAERIAKDCLILPDSGADLDIVAKMADTAAAAAATNHWASPWFQLVKGLAEHRQGHFATAVEWLNKTLTKSGNPGVREVEAYMVLAMAHYKLKQTDEARTAFARGAEIGLTKLPTLEGGDIGGDWIDWIFAHALMREAKAVIEGVSETKTETR